MKDFSMFSSDVSYLYHKHMQVAVHTVAPWLDT